MKEHDELPVGNKLPWGHSQQDFVTAVLALGGHLPNEDDLDALGQRMLNMVDLDPSPFPDFQSMRLALQHGCDVATHQEMLNDELRQYSGALTALHEAGIGFGEQDADEPEDDEIGLEMVQDVMRLNSQLAIQATGGPAVRFVNIPYPGARLTWNASLHDFVTLVVATELFRIAPMEREGDILEQLANSYRSIIDVDYAGCSDFQALRMAYPEQPVYEIIDQKGIRLTKAQRILCMAGQVEMYKRFAAFAVQSEYHVVVAEAVSKQWPNSDATRFMYLFDLVFLPDELIEEVLESREE